MTESMSRFCMFYKWKWKDPWNSCLIKFGIVSYNNYYKTCFSISSCQLAVLLSVTHIYPIYLIRFPKPINNIFITSIKTYKKLPRLHFFCLLF